MDSDDIYDRLDAKIRKGEAFDVEDMMRLVLYPLTYEGSEAKQKAITEAINLAEGIKDEEMMLDALKGIFVFADKIITEDDAKRIRRHMMAMTKIERIIEEEKEKEKEEAIRVSEEGRVKAEQERDQIEREAKRLRELLIANGINPAAAV